VDPNYELRKFKILTCLLGKNNRFKSNFAIKLKNSEIIILIESSFWWDRENNGYRNGNYFSLETIDDLVYQFNYVGFNDLCIYPPSPDMAMYTDPRSKHTKGILAVYYGHTNQNQIGK